MKNKINIKRKNLWFGGMISLLVLVAVVACVKFTGIRYESLTVDAGEVATFYLDVELDPAEESLANKLVIAFLAPKVWNAAENTTMTYEYSEEPGVTKQMVLIPVNESPRNQPGLTWTEALRNKYGVGGNVLDDMEWVAFYSEETKNISNGQKMSVVVTVKIKTGQENLKAILGFYVNHTNDGVSHDDQHQDIMYTPCFQVTNGEGDVMDFCDLHFNMVQPSNVSQNDILTIKFESGLAENVLENTSEIYLNVTAYTDAGKAYSVTSRNEKTKMTRENQYGKTYAITFWPEGYFNIPEGETIENLKYFFTNQDGTMWVKEEEKDEDGEIISETPFNFQFICK